MYLTRTAGIETFLSLISFIMILIMYLTRTAGIETSIFQLLIIIPHKCILHALREFSLSIHQ